jgi:hypothetical protein
MSLANIFGKSFVGPKPHECIHTIGVHKVKSIFPKACLSSKGLDFMMLDQNSEFTKRLRGTWI